MSGPFSVFAAGFRKELLEQGYRPGTAANQLQLMAHLSRWLASHGLAPATLGRVEIERFVREIGIASCPKAALAKARTTAIAHPRLNSILGPRQITQSPITKRYSRLFRP